MGDLTTDLLSANKLIVDEHRRLQRHDPNHPLLKHICDVTDDGFNFADHPLMREEFWDVYDPAGKDDPKKGEPVLKVIIRYFLALRDTVDQIEGIDRSPKPRRQPSSYHQIRHEPEPFRYEGFPPGPNQMNLPLSDPDEDLPF